MARRAERGTRDSGPAPAGECRQASRAVRCHCQRRLPKKGFTNTFKIHYNIIHIKDLSKIDAGTEITPELLRENGIIKRQGPVKLLADGSVAGASNIKVDRVSLQPNQKLRLPAVQWRRSEKSLSVDKFSDLVRFFP